MRHFTTRWSHLAVSTVTAFCACASLAFAATIPAPPTHYVLDQPAWLSEQQRKALETLLIEHDLATGEQIVVSVFQGLDGEDATQRSRKIFEEWLTNRGLHKGALLAIFAREDTGRIESGYGLQALDESAAQTVAHDFLAPELSAHHHYRAIALSVLEILRITQSPLIESGRAEGLLRENGLEGPLHPVSESHFGIVGWIAISMLALLASAVTLNNVIASEAHFTGEGWYRPNPWKLLSIDGIKDLLQRIRREKTIPSGGTDGGW